MTLNYKIIIVTLFLSIPILAYSSPQIKCIAEEKNFSACEILATQGDNKALLVLGRFYETGTEVEKNVEKAEQIYQLLADKNDADGFNQLAMLKEDQGKKQEAILLYQRAIELGSSSANYNLGILYKYNNNYKKAKEMFEKAITDNNSGKAMMSLGDLYFDGFGVEKNMELAEHWYKAAIQADNYLAITRLGILYGNLEKYDEAIIYYQEAIKKGDPAAMNSMGLLYQHGFGVKRDINKAVKFYQDATEQDEIGGLINLGLMYEEGLGVPQNYEKSIELYTRAYQLGYTDIQLRINFLNNHLIKRMNN
ncbi:tetratricopeptide repeat protein [Proteus vulgaris]|uniref:SEL1-like repeat protein n=1 Tax=Proteus TaxID=583 RepID=UPI001411D22C|nr:MULTISPECIES: tetratricopeptide repeat protein [Proteus]NBM55338.1 tetratricopeptide repeat protein [Proteus sp. G2669]UPK81434.1 tetratricopeptide repeat protein [Proteus vulgaris]